ncbi:hypothetical protein CEUSTIGMA_g1294.t1 [Chlamydomonas eustigma]|uniref:RWP-RK domain-containing protein n=1 Tax=Chlamydomonas eustigma TaxID=1157962 RepID=A0A250WSM3_9CHLO|nr:hypothetical protein CEUSTIGMA_g1294.t1 [Chlamydomonas eustigma]|eukprot:GAX73844.1 hypothetical protein CEUSTIGMA_g1294.t1 [Chlamydomonas eustigma]
MDLQGKLFKVIMDVSNVIGMRQAAEEGTLCQVWVMSDDSSTSAALSTQNMPFCVSGIKSDLLALYRCASTRYRLPLESHHATGSAKDIISTVFLTMKPLTSFRVRDYPESMYTRLKDAQRCQVNCTLVAPIMEATWSVPKALAVFELISNNSNMDFTFIAVALQRSLQAMGLHTNGLNEYVTPLRAQQAASLTVQTAKLSAAALNSQPGPSLQLLNSTSQQRAQAINEELNLSGKSSREPSAVNLWPQSVASIQSGTSERPQLGSSTAPAVQPLQVDAMLLDSTKIKVADMLKSSHTQPVGLSEHVGLKMFPLQAPSQSHKLEATEMHALQDGVEESSDDVDDMDEDNMTGVEEGRSGGVSRSSGNKGLDLRYMDLQAQFGVSIKEAAANLGVCVTTLKRACRRYNIPRWPRSQIAKLGKETNQRSNFPGGLPQSMAIPNSSKISSHSPHKGSPSSHRRSSLPEQLLKAPIVPVGGLISVLPGPPGQEPGAWQQPPGPISSSSPDVLTSIPGLKSLLHGGLGELPGHKAGQSLMQRCGSDSFGMRGSLGMMHLGGSSQESSANVLPQLYSSQGSSAPSLLLMQWNQEGPIATDSPSVELGQLYMQQDDAEQLQQGNKSQVFRHQKG